LIFGEFLGLLGKLEFSDFFLLLLNLATTEFSQHWNNWNFWVFLGFLVFGNIIKNVRIFEEFLGFLRILVEFSDFFGVVGKSYWIWALRNTGKIETFAINLGFFGKNSDYEAKNRIFLVNNMSLRKNLIIWVNFRENSIFFVFKFGKIRLFAGNPVKIRFFSIFWAV
jgi:hypothetical protein